MAQGGKAGPWRRHSRLLLAIPRYMAAQLDLPHNNIGDAGAAALANALQTNCTLAEVLLHKVLLEGAIVGNGAGASPFPTCKCMDTAPSLQQQHRRCWWCGAGEGSPDEQDADNGPLLR